MPETEALPAAAGSRLALRRRDGLPAISLVIALHDEQENVSALLEEIAATLDERLHYEVVCVDDGSRDGTLAELKRSAALRHEITLLRHTERCGKSAAVLTGARAAQAALLVLMDGDRQNDPADVPPMLDAFVEGRARDPRLVMVAGQRIRRADSLSRRLSSRIAHGVRSAVLRDGCRDTGCGLKVITREAFLALPFFDGQHRFMAALVRAQGGGVLFCDVADRPRLAGRAKYGLWNRLWVGIGDLLALAWLLRRCHLPSQVERIRVESASGSAPKADRRQDEMA